MPGHLLLADLRPRFPRVSSTARAPPRGCLLFLLLSGRVNLFMHLEVREGMLALWLWSFVLSFVFFGGLAFIFWSGRYVSGDGGCSLAGGQCRQDGGNTSNPPVVTGSSADGSAPEAAV